MRRLLLALGLTLVFVSGALPGSAEITITTPRDNAHVPERPFVEGKVTDPSAAVWVIVHPFEVSDFWVQPPVTVRDNGSWKVQIHIGRPGTIDVGKRFEIRAVRNPNSQLSVGQVLERWPKGAAISDVVEVERE